MRSVTIKTAQNVSIDYELATWIERALAFIVDLIIIRIVAQGIIFLIALNSSSSNMVYYLISIFFSFYTLISELSFKGQTIGKKLLKIKVVQLYGEPLKFSNYVVRWSFRLVEIYMSFGVLASILCGTSKKGQRLGDMLSDTIVIKEKSTNKGMLLEQILKLKNKDQTELKYPNVSVFSEEEMLFAKNALSRINKTPNEAHKKAFSLLYKKISEKLGVKNIPEAKKRDFIKEVINDYIILTR